MNWRRYRHRDCWYKHMCNETSLEFINVILPLSMHYGQYKIGCRMFPEHTRSNNIIINGTLITYLKLKHHFSTIQCLNFWLSVYTLQIFLRRTCGFFFRRFAQVWRRAFFKIKKYRRTLFDGFFKRNYFVYLINIFLKIFVNSDSV